MINEDDDDEEEEENNKVLKRNVAILHLFQIFYICVQDYFTKILIKNLSDNSSEMH